MVDQIGKDDGGGDDDDSGDNGSDGGFDGNSLGGRRLRYTTHGVYGQSSENGFNDSQNDKMKQAGSTAGLDVAKEHEGQLQEKYVENEGKY